ncbi:hypothetical protein LX36DRAFT_64878 [Colletotrichum falcatum]|nr:hypothetical protein LX36DRAFT_64878 [Colletotrichum falcatum]
MLGGFCWFGGKYIIPRKAEKQKKVTALGGGLSKPKPAPNMSEDGRGFSVRVSRAPRARHWLTGAGHRDLREIVSACVRRRPATNGLLNQLPSIRTPWYLGR